MTVKQVKFTDAKQDSSNGENSALEKLEKMITEKFVKEQETLRESITALEKKLKRKQNENQNLLDNIEKLTKTELDRVSDIFDLKETLRNRDEECLRLSDELAVKTKEQLENIRVKDLEGELDDLRKVLKFTTDELWLLKEKCKVESTKTKRKHDMENNNTIDQNMVEEDNYFRKIQSNSLRLQSFSLELCKLVHICTLLIIIQIVLSYGAAFQFCTNAETFLLFSPYKDPIFVVIENLY